MNKILKNISRILDDTLEGLANEDLTKLGNTYRELQSFENQTAHIKGRANQAIDKIDDDQIEAIHLYILVADYLNELMAHVRQVVKPSLDHVDNNHKPLIQIQVEELKDLQQQLKVRLDKTCHIFETLDASEFEQLQITLKSFVKVIRTYRKNQIKRIKSHEVGTRNSILYLNHLGEYRNIFLYSNRILKVLDELIINPEEEVIEL